MEMRYKIILSNCKQGITIREEELKSVLAGINSGSIVIVKEGIFNPSYFVGIVEDKERMDEIAEYLKLERPLKEPSPFAKLLSGKMSMIDSPQERTKIQEKVASEERKLKT